VKRKSDDRAKTQLCALLLAFCACNNDFDGTGETPEGQRLVTGRLVPPAPMDLSRRPIALQIAAAAIDAREEEPIRAFVVSPPFNPAGNGGRPVSFRIGLPIERSFILFLQVPVDASNRIGELVARFRFPRSASGELADVLSGRLPTLSTPLADLDLGVVQITGADPSPGASPLAGNVVLLGEGTAINPLALNDTDGDGSPDFDDPDDDNDLVPDEGDDDANGDGVPDAQQTFDALRHLDENGDQIPDVFQSRR